MCGITAVLTGENEKNVLELGTFLRDAAVVTQLRGTDATGVYQVNGDVKMDSYKLPVSGSVFSELANAQRLFLAGQNAYVTVVHNRKATAGAVNYTTTHPFVHTTPEGIADFALVHNGTLTTWDRKKFDSDSHQLAWEVFTKGNKAFETTIGAFACVYTNMQTETTTVISNGERDLYYAKVQDKDIFLLMSEMGSLSWLAQRNSIKLEDNNVYKVEKGYIYEFPFKSPSEFTKKKIDLAGGWDTHGTRNATRNYGVANRQVSVLPPVKTLRDTIKSEMEALTEEMLGKSLAAKAMSTQPQLFTEIETDENLKLGTAVGTKITPKEASAYQKLSNGIMSEEIIAIPIFWDEASNTLIADVTRVHPKSKILLQDTVVIRDITKMQGKAIMRFTMFPLIVVGLEVPEDNEGSVVMTFIAETPTAREFTKAIELKKAA